MPPAQSMAASISESVPPHLPSARTGRIQLLQVRPATPVALLVIAPSMPTTRVPCQELLATVQSLNSVVLVSAMLKQSPAIASAAAQQIRMVEAHAGVDVGNHDTGAAGRYIPRALGIHRARCCACALQIPLSGVQRIIRCGLRVAALVGLSILNSVVCTQPCERCRERLAANRGLHSHHVQAGRNLMRLPEDEACAPRKRRRIRGSTSMRVTA